MHCLEHGKEWDIDRASGEESALQTREFEWDSLDDDTIEIMKKLETKKTVRHLGVFAKCDAPDTTETGRRVIRKVRARIEDVKCRTAVYHLQAPLHPHNMNSCIVSRTGPRQSHAVVLPIQI